MKKYFFLFLLPNRSISYQKIVKGEQKRQIRMLFSGLAFTYGSTPYQKICRIRHKKRAQLLRTAPLGYDIFILKLPQAALNGMLFHLNLTCRRTFGLSHLRQRYGEHAVVYSGCDSLLHQQVQASLL